jgi:hypothetical protein
MPKRKSFSQIALSGKQGNRLSGMPNLFLGFLILTPILHLSCEGDCYSFSESCDTNALIVCDSNSADLKRYVTRNDSTAIYGTAQAIKSVPDVGEIAWVANNSILKLTEDDYFLHMQNHADTSWVGLEFWAYMREDILTRFDPFYIGEQKVYNRSTYQQDSTVNYSRYVTNLDDFRDAGWQLDESRDNFITVTFLDHADEIVEGEFDFHFSMIEQSTLPGVIYSENVRFRCGRFKAKIFK